MSHVWFISLPEALNSWCKSIVKSWILTMFSQSQNNSVILLIQLTKYSDTFMLACMQLYLVMRQFCLLSIPLPTQSDWYQQGSLVQLSYFDSTWRWLFHQGLYRRGSLILMWESGDWVAWGWEGWWEWESCWARDTWETCHREPRQLANNAG